jgi:hypothetical protein
MSVEISDQKGKVESTKTVEAESKQLMPKSTVVLDDVTSTCQDETVSSLKVVVLGTILLVIGAIGFYNLPGMIATDAKGTKLVNSIYCSAITLLT